MPDENERERRFKFPHGILVPFNCSFTEGALRSLKMHMEMMKDDHGPTVVVLDVMTFAHAKPEDASIEYFSFDKECSINVLNDDPMFDAIKRGDVKFRVTKEGDDRKEWGKAERAVRTGYPDSPKGNDNE